MATNVLTEMGIESVSEPAHNSDLLGVIFRCPLTSESEEHVLRVLLSECGR